MKIILVKIQQKNRNDEKHLRRDSDGIEYILSYIDRHHPHRKKRIYRLTWRISIDSIFRGIGQVTFANNPLSSLIITIGLFIENWQLAFYGLLGTFIST
ncbi:unnamed protein product [Adineta steineri]|uniref:Uncharacterized protein n=1 Tax=Adineta steineri TaxID=433720 RepID=A0A820BNU7_9BILA|nr:unnamed protein product [Adineta steineri]CAF4209029.1 unnamed protein product [Adineta steineri]